MRHGSTFDGVRLLCSTGLVAAALTTGAAQAQTRPGWIDPPARQPGQSEAPASPKTPIKETSTKATSTEAPVAEAPAPPKSLAETPPAAFERPSHAAHPRRAADTIRETRRAVPREAAAPERLRVRPRVAQTPVMLAPAPVAASEARFPEWAAAATRLTDQYLNSVSSSGDAMVASAPRFYADEVRFHGRTLSLAALIAEKRRFVRRWPERRYEAQGGATRTACNAATATCIVRTTFDFRADNPARGARSQGVSELSLTISFAGPRPVIVAESSRVLRRYGGGPLSAIAGGPRGA